MAPIQDTKFGVVQRAQKYSDFRRGSCCISGRSECKENGTIANDKTDYGWLWEDPFDQKAYLTKPSEIHLNLLWKIFGWLF